MADESRTVVIETVDQLLQPKTRRSFLRLAAVGGTAVLLPSLFAACGDDDDATGPGGGSGAVVTLNFDDPNDYGVLNYAYALEQLEAAFYTEVVARSSSVLSADEEAIMIDLRNHEVIHREFLKAALSTNAIGSLSLARAFTDINFTNRVAVLTAARDFEDTGVAAYNGAAQYLKSGAFLAIAGKIVSVEARHAAVIRDLLVPDAPAGATSFAPRSFDRARSAADIEAVVDDYIVQQIQVTNAATFVASGTPDE